jgi:2-methylcitrate dehydratase
MAGMTKFIAPEPQVETRSAVERIGAFAAAARPDHLTAEIRQLYKRNILDSIGCAIAAVAGPSLQSLRDQIEECRGRGVAR